jgi:hypothetical protein
VPFRPLTARWLQFSTLSLAIAACGSSAPEASFSPSPTAVASLIAPDPSVLPEPTRQPDVETPSPSLDIHADPALEALLPALDRATVATVGSIHATVVPSSDPSAPMIDGLVSRGIAREGITIAVGQYARYSAGTAEAYQGVAVRIGQAHPDPESLLAAYIAAVHARLTETVDAYQEDSQTIGDKAVTVLTPENSLGLGEDTHYVYMNEGVIFDIATTNLVVANEVLQELP